MKKAILFILIPTCTILSITPTASAQTMTDYFRYEGVELLALLAHPTNTFDSGSFSVEYNEVFVNIYYEEGYETKLKLYRSGSIFNKLVVLKDTDWWPPFTTLSLIKVVTDDLIRSIEFEDQQKVKSQLETTLRKKWYEFEGKDLALFALTADWWNY